MDDERIIELTKKLYGYDKNIKFIDNIYQVNLNGDYKAYRSDMHLNWIGTFIDVYNSNLDNTEWVDENKDVYDEVTVLNDIFNNIDTIFVTNDNVLLLKNEISLIKDLDVGLNRIFK